MRARKSHPKKKQESEMPAVAPVDPRLVEVPRHPSSPPSYREVAAVTGLDDAKLVQAVITGFERVRVGDARDFVVEVDAPYSASPERNNAPPSYEDALRSPMPAPETSGRLLDEGECPLSPPISPLHLRNTLFFFPSFLCLGRLSPGDEKKCNNLEEKEKKMVSIGSYRASPDTTPTPDADADDDCLPYVYLLSSHQAAPNTIRWGFPFQRSCRPGACPAQPRNARFLGDSAKAAFT